MILSFMGTVKKNQTENKNVIWANEKTIEEIKQILKEQYDKR